MTTGRKYTKDERANLATKVLKLKAEGLTIAIIAQRCNCGTNLVSTIIREAVASGFESGAAIGHD
jgi:predicted transcriptional regulator